MASEKGNEEQCSFWASFSATKSVKSYKWASMFLVLAFLIGGGFVAWFTMKNAAHKLAGGDKYVQLSANSGSYGGGSKAEQAQGFFASEEELAKADPSLKKQLLAASGGGEAGAESGGAAGASAASASSAGGPGAAGGSGYNGGGASGGSGSSGGSAGYGSGLASKLSVIGGQPGGPKKGGVSASKATAMNPEGGGGVASVRSMQSETGKPGGAVKGVKTSILSALKNAFKANLYGARLASNDTARGWIAKTFDGNADARLSLEYDEKMKKDLDVVNPNSIPHFLRDQSLDAANAKSLGASEVDKPFFDKEGTREALKIDKDYQSKKDDQTLAKALFNPLGPFNGSNDPSNGTTPDQPVTRGGTPPSGGDTSVFNDPNDAQNLKDIGLQDFVATEGYGAECGCTQEAPCCCLPPNSLNQQCPMYGPFLPDDPCGGGAGVNSATPSVGDFPPNDTGTMWV